ncbi:MAG: hypothetical protein ACREFJ_06245, partial [Acetobacteraceae bacterium]
MADAAEFGQQRQHGGGDHFGEALVEVRQVGRDPADVRLVHAAQRGITHTLELIGELRREIDQLAACVDRLGQMLAGRIARHRVA